MKTLLAHYGSALWDFHLHDCKFRIRAAIYIYMQPLFLFSFFLMIVSHFRFLFLLSELLSWRRLFLVLTRTLTLARVCSEMSSYSIPGGGVVTSTVAQKINQIFVIQTRRLNCTGGFALK